MRHQLGIVCFIIVVDGLRTLLGQIKLILERVREGVGCCSPVVNSLLQGVQKSRLVYLVDFGALLSRASCFELPLLLLL